jgi:hypothetical protein
VSVDPKTLKDRFTGIEINYDKTPQVPGVL